MTDYCQISSWASVNKLCYFVLQKKTLANWVIARAKRCSPFFLFSTTKNLFKSWNELNIVSPPPLLPKFINFWNLTVVWLNFAFSWISQCAANQIPVKQKHYYKSKQLTYKLFTYYICIIILNIITRVSSWHISYSHIIFVL